MRKLIIDLYIDEATVAEYYRIWSFLDVSNYHRRSIACTCEAQKRRKGEMKMLRDC